KVVPAYSNVQPVKDPKVVKVPEKLTVITPGKEGVPLPKKVPAKGVRTPAINTPPIPGLQAGRKDESIYDIQYLDVDQGMKSSYVYSVFEDSKGNLWFGTDNGLSRFDGQSFIHYTTNEGLSNNLVRCILEDSNGNLWFGTQGGGVNRFDGHHFTHFTTNEGLSNNMVKSMLEDNKGNIWFGTIGGGVNRFDGHHFTHFTTDEGLTNNVIGSILEDSKGNIWFGTNGGVNCFDGVSFTHYTTKEGLNHNMIFSILEDTQGDLWFGTYGGGVNRFDGHHFTHFTTNEGLSSNVVMSMLEDSKGNIWFGTNEGLNMYNGESFSYYTAKEGLSYNMTRSLIEDKQGNLWFGTVGGGVNRYNLHSFSHLTKAKGLSNNPVFSLLEDNKGNLWFGTYSMMNYYDGQSFTSYATIERSSNNPINSLLEDSKGCLWLGTYTGVNYYDGLNFTQYTTKEGLNNNVVRTIFEDHHGDIWFGTRNGLSRFNGQSFIHYTTNEGLSNNMVNYIIEDHHGDIWFGTNGGVNRYDGQNFIHYTTKEGLSNNTVTSILEDSHGEFWFGTDGGGVNHFDGQNFTHFTTKDGLSSNDIASILEDDQENLWLGTNKGINLLAPSTSKVNKKGKSNQLEYKIFNFDKLDGLKRLIFYSKAACLNSKNQLMWGFRDGVTILDLNQFQLPTQAPKNIHFTHIEVNQAFIDFRRLTDSTYQKGLSFGKALSQSFDSVASFYNYPLNLDLPFGLNHLTFHFSAIDWAAPHKIKYSYKLDDENWSSPNSENKADYRNVPYGKHTFQVKAMGVAQVESEIFEYTFVIRPPWWHTNLAYVIYLLLLVGFIWGILQWRLYSIRLRYEKEAADAKALAAEEANEAKSNFLSIVSHELRTPLTSIIGFTKLNKKNLEEKVIPAIQASDAKVRRVVQRNSKNLDIVTSEGQRLTTLINDLLDLAKIESGKVEWKMEETKPSELIERATTATSALFEQKPTIQLIKEIPEELPTINVDRDRMIQVLINLISNAVKFTDSGNITIGITRSQDHQIIAYVKDTGSGIPTDHLEKVFDKFQQVDNKQLGKPKGTGLGLPICKEIVEHHGGKIWVESELDKGSTFYFSIPV
ncbi:MAG: two-component regulator propeller domain-containing protein, partial [Bacteroidota bacterium]